MPFRAPKPDPPSIPKYGGGVSSSSSDNTPPLNPAGEYDPKAHKWAAAAGISSYGAYSGSGDLPPIPLEWIIAPISKPEHCPTVGDTITSFVVSDVIAAVIAFVLCCRPILKKLSCGILGKLPVPGKPRSCNPVWYSWTFGFGMSLLGNLCVSAVIVNSEGYEDLSMSNIFALYASRPRVTILALSLLRLLVAAGSKKKPERGKEYVYLDSYRSTAVAEMLLHIISATFIGITWGRFPNDIYRNYMTNKTNYMLAALGILAFALIFVVPAYWKRDKVVNKLAWRVPFAILTFGAVYAAPWVYWHYFLQLPGSLWCPPKLPILSTIWIGFSPLANMVG